MSQSRAGMQEYFAIRCWHCRHTFNGYEAPWCSCITRRPTLSCIHCLRCFCDAPPRARERIWAAAPAAFLTRHRPPAPLPDNPDPREARHPLVLVIDDNREVVARAVEIISADGYGVVYAGDSREGLEAAALYRPELVLVDALMPRDEARELSRELAGAPKSPRVVIVDFLRRPPGALQLRRFLDSQIAPAPQPRCDNLGTP